MEEQRAKAKQILTHPNFRKLDSQQIQEIYRTFLAVGLTKEDLKNLLKVEEPPKSQEITYLESMPYGVFLNFILAGDIQGKDLISLCNSSPLINEKCNKEFNAEGKVIPQYLFYILLKKMNVPVTDIKMDYRTFYKNVIFNKSFDSLKKKLEILDEATSDLGDYHISFPKNVFDLLYVYGRYESSILGSIYGFESLGEFRSIPENLKPMIPVAYSILEVLRDLQSHVFARLDLKIKIPVTLEIREMAKSLNLSLEEFRVQIFDPFLLENRTYIDDKAIPYVTFENCLNYDLIFAMLLREASKYINLNKSLKDKILENWRNIIEENIEEYEERKDDTDDEEDLEAFQRSIDLLESISELSPEEAGYLAALHEKVLSGKLPVLTHFSFEELIKY
jgi:hypothetical protein